MTSKSQKGWGSDRPAVRKSNRTAAIPIQDQYHKEQLAAVARDSLEYDSEGEDSELHVYEVRDDTRGGRIRLRVGTKSEFNPIKDKSHRASLVLVRYYGPNKDLKNTELEIRSRYIKKALQEVIGTYPGVSLHTSGRVIIREPPMCLFHYRRELEAFAKSALSPITRNHLGLCLGYMKKTLERELQLYEVMVEGGAADPALEHEYLWMAYVPGDLLYEKTNGTETISRLVHVSKSMKTQQFKTDEIDSWMLTAERIEYQGQNLSYVPHTINIRKYDGCKPIRQQPAFPLRYHPEEKRIRQHLSARGRQYLSLAGVHYCFYDGPAKFYDPEILMTPKTHANVQHRIIVDCVELKRIISPQPPGAHAHPGSRPGMMPNRPPGFPQHPGGPGFALEPRVIEQTSDGYMGLSEEEQMMCSHEIAGYSLAWKSHLVFDEDKKRLIRSLVDQQEDPDARLDDYIKGKGKGLIFLLHGPPGVGKTFTAESIADHTRRPLLTISSGQMIGSTHLVESRLSALLALATKWKALVLIDEADVFMQERTIDHLERNALVSIFLRIIEYFEGTLFLTTNRAETLDTAFHSRIHLSISYPPLSPKALGELWTTGIIRGCGGQRPRWLTAKLVTKLTKSKINGREIKNIISMAHALARNTKRGMRASDILQGLEALKLFEANFNELAKHKMGRSSST